MPRRFVFLAVLAASLGVAVAAFSQRPSLPGGAAPSPIPATLRTAHPRLLVLEADLVRVRARVATDPRARQWRDALVARAVRILDEPVVERVLVGSQLLAQSRLALERITTLAGLFLLEGDRRMLARATAEMRAVAAFQDWNPSHFLDVAEMTAAMALGYDWLYSDLTAEERTLFRAAIVNKGLTPGFEAIAAGAFWVAEGRNTWSEVSLGGLTLGALAVAEHASNMAVAVLGAIQRPAFRSHLARFAPDGGDVDGPGYWGYSTQYITWMLAALDTALGEDFGLGQIDGLAATGQFRMYSIGPSGRQWNYADAIERPTAAPQMMWMAGHYDRPEYAAHERSVLAGSHLPPSIFHLLWSTASPARTATMPPRSKHFRAIDVAVLGGDWRDSSRSWVAVRGGVNTATPGHLDLGSVVIDALGQRWAVDLGPDYFALPDYFGPLRWTYFRLRTESHNTIQVDGHNQDLQATAPIVAFNDDGYRAFAVADLTAAYRPAVTRARRGVALVDGRDVLIQDEIDGAGSSTVVWQMATRAQVTFAGRAVVLRQNGRFVTVRVLEPETAVLRADVAVAPAPQAQPDVVLIRVVLPAGAPTQRVVVWFSTGDRPPPPVTPLEEWR